MTSNTRNKKSVSKYQSLQNVSRSRREKGQAHTCESSIEPVGATKKAPSSKGGDGSPSSSSSSSTTDGFTESGVPSEAANIQ